MLRRSFMCAAAIFSLLAIGASEADSDHHRLCKGFVPPNDLRIPVGAKRNWAFMNATNGKGVTEAQYNTIVDRFERLYRDDFTKAGGTLIVNRLWESSLVGAFAGQKGDRWEIDMHGGLARHAAITPDGLALVICHEAGHHLGGAPKKRVAAWATNEGAADYYAALKCLRRIFAEDDNATIVADAAIDLNVKENCERQFTAPSDRLICQRTSMASASVGQFFADLFREPRPPAFGTPDPSVVEKIFDGHPKSQCRLDTYFNGSICHVDVSVALSNSDFREGSCVQPQDAVGFRPLCWFKP